jgi:putative two-component system response regulator
VDDEPRVLDSFRRSLASYRSNWAMSFLDSPLEAWQRLIDAPVDLVVSDLRMPGLNGLELLARMQSDDRTRDIPLIIVTGSGEKDVRRQAIELGATDLLEKPVDSAELVARIRNALRLKGYQDQLKLQNEHLELRVRERTAELEASRLEVIRRLAKAAEFRDEETGNHVVRVGLYSRLIAEAMGFDAACVESLGLTAPLHDIGKIGIPDSILLKPGRLTDEERRTMQGHCVIGARILLQEPETARSSQAPDVGWFRSVTRPDNSSTLQVAASIALTHHEKWDGSGYPQGLAGEAIPIAGRIVAISDVFDALTSRRPYKRAFSEEEALNILQQDAGRHFDPDVHAGFLSALDRIRDVRVELMDQSTAEVEQPVPI